ncbi:MAG: aspartate aminotransferase family protein [Candidatus Rokuibacteriota bacterium]|nr:MAG: aspartate aminotransferase family protein [Candidatus Rokubacteria bacterium]
MTKPLDGRAALAAAEAKLAARTPRSAAAFDAARRVLPGGVTSNIRYADPHPLFVREARGGTVWDLDGNPYVDCRLGFGPVLVGHSPEWVTAAVSRALMGGTVYALPHAGEAELAEKVVAAVPGAEMVTFCSSGSEATLHALRLARAATGRRKIAKFEGGYHGVHDAVMVSVQFRPEAAGASEQPVATADSPGIPEETIANTLVLPYNHPSAFDLIAAHAHELAAVIVEPVQGAAGSIPATPAFLEGLRAATRRHGVVLIFDEVITGFRLALGGAQEHFGVQADLVTFGKVLGGGFPFGALAGTRDLMRLFSVPEARAAGGPPVAYGGTFNGNPTSVAAANAVLDFLREHPAVYPDLNDKGDRIRREVQTAAAARGIPLVALGMGSVFSFRFVEGPVRSIRDLVGEDPGLREALFLRLLSHGILGHTHHSFLCAAHADGDIKRVVEGYHRALDEIVAAA